MCSEIYSLIVRAYKVETAKLTQYKLCKKLTQYRLCRTTNLDGTSCAKYAEYCSDFTDVEKSKIFVRISIDQNIFNPALF